MWHCLCIFLVAFGNVYNGVMVVFMHVWLWLWLCMYSRSNMPCEFILCNLGHHDAIGCYDANELVEIEQGMEIIIMKLQH